MAIVKPIKVRVGNLAGLRAVLDYIKDDHKTQYGALVYCKDLLKGKEYQQMIITKRAFHKDTGRQYAHFVQSFDPRDNVTPELAYKIGQEFIRRYEHFHSVQVVMAVHTNEPHMKQKGRNLPSALESWSRKSVLGKTPCSMPTASCQLWTGTPIFRS